MATCNIRDIRNELLRSIKVAAAMRGMTLKAWAEEAFEEKLNGDMHEELVTVQESPVQKLSVQELREVADGIKARGSEPEEEAVDGRPQCPECLVPLFENRKMRMWWCKCGHQQRMK